MLHKAAFKTIPINTLYKLKVVNAVKHCQCNIFPSSAQKGRINDNVFFYLNWGQLCFLNYRLCQWKARYSQLHLCFKMFAHKYNSMKRTLFKYNLIIF